MTSSWDEFDRLEQPPAAGELLPYTAWGALIAWGLGPHHCVLAPRTPPMVRHDCDGRQWLEPPTAEDIADVDDHVAEVAHHWGLPTPPPRGWDFIAVLPTDITIDQVYGTVNDALETLPVTQPTAAAAAALTALAQLLHRTQVQP